MDPEVTNRSLDAIEYVGRWAVPLAALKAAIEVIYKPLMTWRRKQLAQEMREVFAPELAQMQMLIDKEGDCAQKMGRYVEQMERNSEQVAAVFEDIDAFLAIAKDNRERHDEKDELLNVIFHLDRRVDSDRTKEIDSMIEQLANRATLRRRSLAIIEHATEEGSK